LAWQAQRERDGFRGEAPGGQQQPPPANYEMAGLREPERIAQTQAPPPATTGALGGPGAAGAGGIEGFQQEVRSLLCYSALTILTVAV
jgi:hypothetical protein